MKKTLIGFTLIFLGILIGWAVSPLFPSSMKFLILLKSQASNIGSLMAGIGTIGLFVIALITVNSWKKQATHNFKVKALNDLYLALGNYLQLEKATSFAFNKSPNNPNTDRLVDQTLNKIATVDLYQTQYEAITKKDAPKALTVENSNESLIKFLSEDSFNLNARLNIIDIYIEEAKKAYKNEFKTLNS